ncbi:MAG TPA: carbamoyl phosphate synthase large subunit, partial [Spirochaetes bacterium]|nr:carbamoyl phosphate synthase large subunit [Spirochaetota bacterium]
NIQFAIKDDLLFVLEVNPRASRTVPFVSKATGVPLAKIAAKLMMGKKLSEFGLSEMKKAPYICVKEAVLPFNKFPGADTILTPEMKSTGEVMGIAAHFGEAFYKAELAAGDPLPMEGTIFLSINQRSKEALLPEMKQLHESGYRLVATEGTARFMNDRGIACERVFKVSEGRPNITDLIKNGEIHLVVNTPTGKIPKHDAFTIRQSALRYRVPIITNISAAKAAVQGLLEVKKNRDITVRSLQEYHEEVL